VLMETNTATISNLTVKLRKIPRVNPISIDFFVAEQPRPRDQALRSLARVNAAVNSATGLTRVADFGMPPSTCSYFH